MFKRAQIYGIAIVLASNINCKTNGLHNLEIKGTIDKLSYSNSKQRNNNNYTTISINKTEYKIKITSAPGNEFSFIDVARNGDSVFKASNSDTLFLTRIGYDGVPRFPFIVKSYSEN